MDIVIAGFSSVGKKTLIRSLLNEDKFRSTFGVRGSIGGFGYSFNPFELVFSSRVDTKLIQWQSDPLCMKMTRGLYNIPDNCKIFLLWREYELHHADWVRIYKDTEPWVTQTSPAYLISKWHQVVDSFSGMNFEVVNITDWFSA